jgi:putative tryptophan/tyrosine transport system substrate-binding protein
MRMDVALLSLLCLTTGLAAVARAQQPRVYRVLIIMMEKEPYLAFPQMQGLRDRLGQLGYVEGKNIVYDLLREDTYDALRSSLKTVQKNVDVIVPLSDAETAIAKELTDKIPIVFMPSGDPVGAGFIRSLASPGTNLTGLTYVEPKAIAKQLEVFKEFVPSLTQIILLIAGQEVSPTGAQRLVLVRRVAAQLRINLVERPVKSIAEAEHAVSILPKRVTTGVFPICAGLFRGLKNMASITIQKKLPMFGCSVSQVAEQGVLVSYAPDLHYIGTRAAWYMDRILKGARPQELPVETPRKFDLAINLKTADTIGIKIPPEVLQRANKVLR